MEYHRDILILPRWVIIWYSTQYIPLYMLGHAHNIVNVFLYVYIYDYNSLYNILIVFWIFLKKIFPYNDTFSPHWGVGFLFLVLYPLLPSSPPPACPPKKSSHTHTHITHSVTHSHTHITHTHTHTYLTHSHHSPSHTHTSLTHITHTHTRKHSLTHSHTRKHSLTHSLPHTHITYTHTHHSHTHTSLTHTSLTHTHTHHSHTSLTHTHTSLTHTHHCVAGVGQCALPRGRMYAPVSLWRPLVSAALPVAFAWQAWA